MWTVVYISQDKEKVDNLVSILDKNNVITMIKTTSEDDFGVGVAYEILVPQTELEAAQDIIVDTEIS